MASDVAPMVAGWACRLACPQVVEQPRSLAATALLLVFEWSLR